jgi:hypothetical protein
MFATIIKLNKIKLNYPLPKDNTCPQHSTKDKGTMLYSTYLPSVKAGQ